MTKIYYIILSVLIYPITFFSQTLVISGILSDTTEKKPLHNAVVMAIKLKDSTLVSFTRTDVNGKFKIEKLPIDTYEVVVSHPKFSDQSFFVVGSEKNNVFDFGSIVLPTKNRQLHEVVIFAFKDPIYYRGDTLVYTADSFKVKPNATVEDLLKKLPGISVDKQGKIKSQGTEVDKVLVDGDEFFGSDPTIATKNLNATSIESVQVYDKKNEDATSEGDKETLKVLDLKLKEEAKKGYFGKVTAAGDFNKFYEGELLSNRFNKKQKISVFGMVNNTPRTEFDWSDMRKYDLFSDNFNYGDEGMYFFTNNNTKAGIPRTIKTGFVFNDKINDKTNITSNYTYNNGQLATNSETTSQTFLADTNFTNVTQSVSSQISQSHKLNLSIEHKLDSLITIGINPKINVGINENDNYDNSSFISAENIKTRSTSVKTSGKTVSYDFNNAVWLRKKFKKEDRRMYFKYMLGYVNSDGDGSLLSKEEFYTGQTSSKNNFDQHKQSVSTTQSHNTTLQFNEPLNKKNSIEFTYDFGFNTIYQDKKTFDGFNGEYITVNNTFSNNFKNNRVTNRFGVRHTYEIKKQRVSTGIRFRNIDVKNENYYTNQNIHQSVNNVLPFLNYSYTIKDNSRIRLDYSTSSDIPSISQLQPVIDNNNPNKIFLGNPDLLPNFKQSISLNYNTYKPLSGKWFYLEGRFNTINNDFANSTFFDSLGRTITTPININGNYDLTFYNGSQIPFFSKKLEINPSFNASFSKRINKINNALNTTTNQNYNPRLGVYINLEKIEIGNTVGYNYNIPQSTLNNLSNKPYSTTSYEGYINVELPLKFKLTTEIQYTINQRREQGFNRNILLVNGSLSKTLLKNENLIISFNAYDILNRNVNINRTVMNNVITDSKTNIISQYFLLKAVLKFNSSKTKENDEDEF